MNPRYTIILTLIVLALIGVGVWRVSNTPASQQPTTTNSPQPTQSGTPSQTISDGTITVAYSDQNFALATTQDQILVRSYIPPCNEPFNYCLYYNGTAYAGTNFESAGVRIGKRTDLTTSTQCLQTQPDGYQNLVPTVSNATEYQTSVFSPIGDAGAGHFANGALYRLFYKNSCYEFETRIGQTQFANYPAGSIQEFTPAEQAALQSQLTGILNDITLPLIGKVSFPNLPTPTTPTN